VLIRPVTSFRMCSKVGSVSRMCPRPLPETLFDRAATVAHAAMIAEAVDGTVGPERLAAFLAHQEVGGRTPRTPRCRRNDHETFHLGSLMRLPGRGGADLGPVNGIPSALWRWRALLSSSARPSRRLVARQADCRASLPIASRRIVRSRSRPNPRSARRRPQSKKPWCYLRYGRPSCSPCP
jgi:hypothetical protein